MVSNYDMYVYLSYLPKISKANIRWLEFDEDCATGRYKQDELWWIKRGVKAFKDTIEQQLCETPANATHVVPLSSGLDSRAILAELSQRLPKSQIVTMTFGIPGAWDYEIAQQVARKVGVQHEPMNLLDEEWDLDGLLETGACMEHPASVFEAYAHRKICKYYGPDCVYWSGFLAGSLAGVHLQPTPSAEKEQAVRRFLKDNRTPNFKDDAFHEEMSKKVMAEFPWEENLFQSKMCLDQQLDYGIRHRHYIRSVLLFDDYIFKAPFIHKTWLSFILNVPYRWLLHKSMYIQILIECYPDLYRLPVKMNAAQPLSASRIRVLLGKAAAKIKPCISPIDQYRTNPKANYINFSETLRHKTKLQELVYSNLQDLKKRGIYSDDEMNDWWQDHLYGKVDNTMLLMNLSSLELLLKSGRERDF